MQNKNKITQFFLPIFAVIGLSFGFFAMSLSFSQLVYGYGYNGYGYNCDDHYGYGYVCNDDDDHKGGLSWKKYKHYRQRYDKEESKKIYFKIRYLKRSKNPVLNSMFWEMRNIYLAHKFDSKEIFDKLDQATQEKFKLFKEYHGHLKYREYKDEVY